MRLFVALEIPATVTTTIEQVQRQLKRSIRADRWQPVHNLHLTLHFLGEVEESSVPHLCADLDIVSRIIPPIQLSLGSFGIFGQPQKPRVLWLGIDGNRPSLSQLHLLLGKRFDLHEGVSYDRRPYSPHITLARNPHADVLPLPLHEWQDAMAAQIQTASWQVKRVALFRSELRPEGAVHTVIHASELSGT